MSLSVMLDVMSERAYSPLGLYDLTPTREIRGQRKLKRINCDWLLGVSIRNSWHLKQSGLLPCRPPPSKIRCTRTKSSAWTNQRSGKDLKRHRTSERSMWMSVCTLCPYKGHHWHTWSAAPHQYQQASASAQLGDTFKGKDNVVRTHEKGDTLGIVGFSFLIEQPRIEH